MNVGELIDKLRDLDPNLLVVVPETGSDPNYFSLDLLECGWFAPRESGFYYSDDDDEYEPQEGDVKAVAIQ